MYPYITKNNLLEIQHYNYSAFYGVGFLRDYLTSRTLSGEYKATQNLYNNSLYDKCQDRGYLKLLIKTFEVNKRLYESYDKGFSRFSKELILKPNKESSFLDMGLYVGFAYALGEAFMESLNLLYLNTLLKCNDTLLSLANTARGGGGIMPFLAKSIDMELEGALYIANKAGLCKKKDAQNLHADFEELIHSLSDFEPLCTPLPFTRASNITFLEDMAMIYAPTARSHIYLQALLQEGILPRVVVFLAEDSSILAEVWRELEDLGCLIYHIPSKDINDKAVFSLIMGLSQTYIIYSGYGGGILEHNYFEKGKFFIHVHAGKLPHYKGSTTCYYSLLEDGEICASAMFLSHKLDGGDILAEVSLDKAAICSLKNSDIDTTIEPYIRSLAIIKALHSQQKSGAFSPKKHDITQADNTYYRIHPLLKHFALLSVFKEEV